MRLRDSRHRLKRVMLLATACLAVAALEPASAFAQSEDDVVVNEFVVNPSAGKEYVELLVTRPGGIDLQGWTLSDAGTRTTAVGTSTTEGDVTLPTASYLASVPQGTLVVLVLTVGTTNTLAEDTSTSDGNRRLVLIVGTTAGLTTAGTLDLSTNENLHLYAGTRAGSALIDQVLTGNNTSFISGGASWGDNNGTTINDNVNGGSSIPSNAAVRFVPTENTLAAFQDNDTGARFRVDTSSYGTPGERNTGVASDTAVGGPASTPATGTGAANPSNVLAGDTTLLTVTVVPGSAPTSTGITVTADLTAIGGPSAQPLFDDATNGDATAGDNVFSFRAAVAETAAPGSKTIPVTIRDAQDRSSSTSIALTVLEIIPIGVVQGAVTAADNGAIHRSPYAPASAPTSSDPCAPRTAGQTVTVRAVVYQKILTASATSPHGLFLQNTEAADDDDPLTSDGIFVFLGGSPSFSGYTPNVGDEIVVTGRVSEFFCLTQLSSVSLVRIVRENVPLALEVPPFVTEPSDDLAEANRYWERREGMRARVFTPSLVVSGRDVFSGTDAEVWVIRGDHPVSLRTDPYARRVFRDVHPLDNRPSELFDDGNGYRIMLGSFGLKATTGDQSALLAPARTYDMLLSDPLTGDPTGGLYYSFGKYGIQVERQLFLAPGVDPALNAPPSGPARPAEYSVATYNVENLYDYRDDPFDGCDFVGNSGCPGVSPPFNYVPSSDAAYRAHLAGIAAQIVNDLHSPEIVLVQEAEDQDICSVSGNALSCGAGSNAANNADGRPDTLQELTLAILAAGGPRYQAALDRDGADDRGIVSGFLYRTDRVQLPGATAEDPVLGRSPSVSYRSAGLAYNAHVQNPKALNAVLPADVDTTTGRDGPNVYTRPPQVARFRLWQGGVGTGTPLELYVLSNHFSSTPDARVGQRTEQARYNAAIVAALQAANPNVRVMTGGDFNVFPRPDDPFSPGHPLFPSDQLAALYELGLVNLFGVLADEVPAAAYSYVFQGQSQTLDSQFTTRSLRSELAQVRVAHINAGWPAEYEGDGARGVSDHDPMVSRFAFPAVATTPPPPPPSSVFQPPATCSLTVSPGRVFVGIRTAVTVRANAGDGSRLAGVSVTLRGPGFVRTAVTGDDGVARFLVRASRTGSLSATSRCGSRTTQAVKASSCAGVRVTPDGFAVGRRTAARVSVRVNGRPVARTLVTLRGPGVRASATTNASGVARTLVTPTRTGVVRLSVPAALTCTRAVGVAGSAGGQLTGRS